MKKNPHPFPLQQTRYFFIKNSFSTFSCVLGREKREKKVIISFLVMLEIFFLLLFHFHLALFNHCLLLMKLCTNNLITNALRFVMFSYFSAFLLFSIAAVLHLLSFICLGVYISLLFDKNCGKCAERRDENLWIFRGEVAKGMPIF